VKLTSSDMMSEFTQTSKVKKSWRQKSFLW